MRDSGMRSEAQPLRIGIVSTRTDGFQNWQLRIFDRIMENPRLTLSGFLVRAHQKRQHLASPLFAAISSLERVTLAREPKYRCKRFVPEDQRFKFIAPGTDDEESEVEQVARLLLDLDLDLVINLTSQPLSHKTIPLLPFGELTLSFYGQTYGTEDWSAYASVITKQPSTTMQLHLRQGDPCKTVCIASSSFNAKFSAARSAGFMKERSVSLLLRELDRIADAGHLDAVTDADEPARTAQSPSNADLVQYAVRLSGNILTRTSNMLLKKLGSGSAVWTLFTGNGSIEDFDPREAVEIAPGKNEIRADPFLLKHCGACYLFYEAYAQGDSKAHIAVSRIEGSRLEELGIALECDYHLSFPFVFRHNGELFMMPETNQARRLEIWRCVEFPLKWEPYSTALEGLSPADSTLTYHKGQWWLFTNLSDFHAYEDHCSELHIFAVDGPLLSSVVAHRRNPVVIDSTLARNAGRMFELGGRLHRPSQQNMHGIYGYGLNIMEIEKLDLEHYKERCVRTITPDFGSRLIGCHHFDAVDGRYVIDARVAPKPGIV